MKFFVVMVLSVMMISACGQKPKAEKVGATTSQAQNFKKQEPTRQEMEAKKELQKENIKSSAEEIGDQLVDFSSIEGRRLSDLYKPISGLKGVTQETLESVKDGKKKKPKSYIVVPKSATVNYGKQLTYLWHGKLDRKKGVTDATIDNSHTPIAVYTENAKRMNLKRFISEADREVAAVAKSLDWSGVCHYYKLGRDECKVFRTLGTDIRGVDLIAYGLTELLPSPDGALNVAFIDIVLRNAGANYLMAIPAMGDRMLSLGFYQFTSYALRDDHQALEGASRVNRFLPVDQRIPGSVIKLRNGQNHRAAYLFALHNFANMVQKTSSKEFTVLQKVIKDKPGDLVTYMACAHHAPGLAIRSMKVWLSKGAKGSINPFLQGRLKSYGAKTDSNLAALEKYNSTHK